MNAQGVNVFVLLGAWQLFSTVLRPQTNGVIDRPHRVSRAGMAIMVGSLAQAVPRRMPRFLRRMEHKLRHKTLTLQDGSTTTPYACVHGFFVSSALQLSLEVLEEIPVPWLNEIVIQSQRVSDALATIQKQMLVQERRSSEKAKHLSVLQLVIWFRCKSPSMKRARAYFTTV